jgi:hypothetical protein
VGTGPMFAECCGMDSYPGDRATILAKMAAAYPAEGGFPAGYHPNRPLKRAKTDPNFWVMENGRPGERRRYRDARAAVERPRFAPAQ